jgi:hypothetical protein
MLRCSRDQLNITFRLCCIADNFACSMVWVRICVCYISLSGMSALGKISCQACSAVTLEVSRYN